MPAGHFIADYGQTVTPEVYIRALKGHQYIPQADQCIKDIIKAHVSERSEVRILDVGCGPGRLTLPIAQNHEGYILGVDISESFITYAKKMESSLYRDKKSIATFVQMNFAIDEIDIPPFDVIIMQGVMHHIHGEDRAKFLDRCNKLLKDDGILIVGDEFIKEYETEEERILNVAKFYLHIIDEARKGGFEELAKEEAKNLIDDCFSGTAYAGLAVDKTFEHIYQYASTINQLFYDYGSSAGLNFNANNTIRNMFRYINQTVDHLINTDATNFNRGDLKVSKSHIISEFEAFGLYSVTAQQRNIGPVDNLGGMAVFVFERRDW